MILWSGGKGGGIPYMFFHIVVCLKRENPKLQDYPKARGSRTGAAAQLGMLEKPSSK
jgi:hypothetical protein